MYYYIKDRLFLDCSIIFEMYIIIFVTLLHIQCYYFYYYFKPYVYIIHIFPFKSGYLLFNITVVNFLNHSFNIIFSIVRTY